MNREIKFRAWDKFNGQYWYTTDSKSIGVFFTNMQELIEGDNDIIIQQFTGLKDKNGKEIYEGDIVKHPAADEPEDLGWEIIFEDYAFQGRMVRVIGGARELTGFDNYFANCEIIGNIYENPELLNP